MNLQYPIYFSAGLTEKVYTYQLHVWYYSCLMCLLLPGQPLLQALYLVDKSEH